MAVNKVVYGGQTVIDLTNDTVTPSDLMSGVTAHGANGQTITGTFSLDTEISAQDNLIAQIKSALEGKASGGGGTTIETCTVDFDNGGNWFLVCYATISNNQIEVKILDNPDYTVGFNIQGVIKGSNIWVEVTDSDEWECTNATFEKKLENSVFGTIRCSFKISDNASIYA